MNKYKIIQNDLVEFEGFTRHDAARATHMMEVEDCCIEYMHTLENSKRLENEEFRAQLAIETERFWKMLARLGDRERAEQLWALSVLAEQIRIERQQRKLLADKGYREQDSIFLAAILKYFCRFSDSQIVAIMCLVNPPQPGGGGASCPAAF